MKLALTGSTGSALVGASMLLALVVPPSSATAASGAADPPTPYPRPGVTGRVSVATDGSLGDGHSVGPAIDDAGRYVVFTSIADTLVGPKHGVWAWDVLLRDRETGTTEWISKGGAEPPDCQLCDHSSQDPAISGDGRFVAFRSGASYMVPGKTNTNISDVFVVDRGSGDTERVSMAFDGGEANGPSWTPSLNLDGRYVAFMSEASNLVPEDTNDTTDVFVHDREAGVTERVSVACDAAQGSGWSSRPSISADGRFVSFESTSSDLVPGDTNGNTDIFVHDRETDVTERVSVASDGSQALGLSSLADVSADGRAVVFVSEGPNLVPGDTNALPDVFVHDRIAGTTHRVSVSSDGAEANGSSLGYPVVISGDGRHVAFRSEATNLVPDDTNGHPDVFLHDRATGATERISVATDGAQGDRFSELPALGADGSVVAFTSWAATLVPEEPSGWMDIFVRERGPATGIGDLAVEHDGATISVTGRAAFSGSPLTSNDANGPADPVAEALGAAMAGASITYRHEPADLLVRWRPTSSPPVAGASPGIVYGLSLEAASTTWQVRALRAAATSDPPSLGHVGLYRCDPACVPTAVLGGSFASAGPEVWASVPLEALGLTAGAELAAIRAFTALGEAGVGAVHELDEMALPPAVLPAASVMLGLVPAGTAEDDVTYSVEAALVDGRFSGTVEASPEPGEVHDLWARACLGHVCGRAVSTPVPG